MGLGGYSRTYPITRKGGWSLVTHDAGRVVPCWPIGDQDRFPHLVCCIPVRYFEWFIWGRSCLRPSNSVCVCLDPHQSNPTSTTHTPSREVCHPIVGRVFPLKCTGWCWERSMSHSTEGGTCRDDNDEEKHAVFGRDRCKARYTAWGWKTRPCRKAGTPRRVIACQGCNGRWLCWTLPPHH